MTINDYMAELERELRRRRAPRARLLRETDHHLHDLGAELAAASIPNCTDDRVAVTRAGLKRG